MGSEPGSEYSTEFVAAIMAVSTALSGHLLTLLPIGSCPLGPAPA